MQEISEIKSAVIDKNIEKWKENLLDLTKRNNMINFKYNKKNVLRVNEDLNWLYEMLIKEETSLVMNNLELDYDLEDYEQNKEFEKLLSKLRQKRNSFMKEKGINVLYITLGTLKWKEFEHSDVYQYSPILMIPVELVRSNKNSPFKLSIFDNQCLINPSLQFKLKADFGIEMPVFEEDIIISEYLDDFKVKISQIDSWEITTESYLGLFSFSKIALYHDLIRYKEKIKEHSIISNVASGEITYSDETFDEIYKVDSNESALESFQVLDADSSQQEAAITAKQGYSFVMQGPPGTGKSQTITNIIAECLAVGKKVLFVSEKMAALEVVKKRLEMVGLGDFCLELHSNKVNKKTVIGELYNQYSGSNMIKTEDNQFLYNYENIKEELNNYIEELHRPHHTLNKSAFWYHGRLAQLKDVEAIQFEVKNLTVFDQQNLAYVEKLINELQLKQSYFPKYRKTFWRYTTIRELSMNKINEVKYHLSEFSLSIEGFKELFDEINENLGIFIPNISSTITLKSVLLLLAEGITLSQNWFEEEDFDGLLKIVDHNNELYIKYKNLDTWVKSSYKTSGIDVNRVSFVNLIDELSLVLKDSIIDRLYQRDIREEIIKELQSFDQNIILANEVISQLEKIFGENVKATIHELKTFHEILQLLLKGQQVPSEWLENPDFIEREVIPRLTDDANIHNKLANDTEKVSHVFDKQVLNEENNELYSIFNKQSLSEIRYRNSLEFVYNKGINLSREINDSLITLNRIIDSAQQLKDTLGYERELSLQGIGYLLQICNSIGKIHYCKKEWLNENDFLLIKRKVEKFKGKLQELNSIKAEIEKKFESSVFETYSEDMFIRFKTQYTSVFRFIKGAYHRDMKQLMFQLKKKEKLKFDEMFSYVSKIHSYQSLKKEITKNELDYIDLLGKLYQDVDSDLEIIDNNFKAIQEYIELCQKIGYKNTKFETFILNKDNLDKIFELKNILSNSSEVFNQKFLNFEKELNVTDIDSSLVNLSELQITLKEKLCWADSVQGAIQQIAKYARTTFSLNFEELINYVHTLESISNSSIYISNNDPIYKGAYGFLYKGINTKWDVLFQLSEWIKTLHKAAGTLKNEQKEALLDYLKDSSSDNNKELKQMYSDLSSLIESLQGNINHFSNNFQSAVISSAYSESIILQNVLLSSFEKIINTTNKYVQELNEHICHLEDKKLNPFLSVEEILEHIMKVDDYISIKMQKEDEEQRNVVLFESLYQKDETDWLNVKRNVEQAKNIANSIRNCNITLNLELIKFICSGQTDAYNSLANKLNQYLEKFYKSNEYYNKIFEFGKSELEAFLIERLPIMEANAHIKSIIDDIENLELVVKIRVIQDDFIKADLEDFFLKVINKEHLTHGISDIFYKSINTIILDEIYSKSDILKKFEKSRFEDLLHNFRKLDKKQLNYNSTRIRNRLMENRKEIIESGIGRRQANTLAYENGKKKRHMPIRKLFGTIPELLISLKPCMLMSPLSVCEFLDVDQLQFDVVVFDEASQICPEDAITPMLRGKDVIIAGDIHQLPPTRFFKTDLSSDDFDDEEEDDSPVFESILDMCANIMPQKNLKWHYRSRHESLIAYSNKNFYNNSLYTFPSPELTNDKQGVRFVHVKDGIYDKSGKRTNSKEADKVVELVFNHFRENPARSLGVITFSQAQMDEIQDKIYDRLHSFPELEQSFNENLEDAFFVKNLENVQGDERDTIIISIGYGKDSNGNLNHNFGPLNKAGGERRLNVAVTRSKHELVLVSSISDLDIDLKRTNSVGVRLLKEYIQFARTGSLPESIFVNDNLEFDSPLEQDIYNSLVKLGYEVHTQIGSSGYRIDLAIVDPENHGRYLLGVECDGATYHSTKSARDRDRLRQEVLENLGWRIYRIWSQDWFKQKEKEIEKISSFIKGLK